MFLNHFKVAWRALRHDTFYTAINIVGLAVATAVFLVIFHFVSFEYSYESTHEKADDIYRLTYDLYEGSNYITTDCETHPLIGSTVKNELAGVVDYVRVQNMDGLNVMKHGEQFYRIEKTYAADPSFFNIFTYKMLLGDKKTALEVPMQMVLTESQAKRVFGANDPMGESIQIGEQLYKVAGVMEDSPANTHLKVDMLISFSSLSAMGWDMTSWNGNNNYTYLQLDRGIKLGQFNQDLLALSKKIFADRSNGKNVYTAEPIKSIHLHSQKSYEPEANGSARSVNFMLVAALFILVVGSINYINLTTARSSRRMKESGVRKLLGSSRKQLFFQFLAESILVNVAALAIALLLVLFSLPFYFQLLDRPGDVDLFSSVSFWFTCVFLLLFNCLLSGLYPAISLSAIKPIRVLQRSSTGSVQNIFLRKVLVVAQFTTALVVLPASLIIYQQLRFVQQQDLGLNTSQVLVLKAPLSGESSFSAAQLSALRDAFEQLPGVERVSASGALPGVSQNQIGSSTGISRYGSDIGLGHNFYRYGIDADFVPTMEIKLLAGNNFRKESLNKDEVIINESAARLFGFDSAAAAVGQKLQIGAAVTIVGVMEDYHQLSMKEAILPMLHHYQQDPAYYSLKLSESDLQNTISQVEGIWNEKLPGYPLEYHFLDQLFDQQYKTERQFSKLTTIFSLLTLFITCLGLLGLTAYSIRSRTKEISIRKVLGASIQSIVQLISADFIKLIGIALLISTPITWFSMSRWLADFAYHIDIQWWVFALSGLLTLIIAILILFTQSLKAAAMNPANVMKTE